MLKPNWDKFKSKFNDNPTYYFEYFCYLLFCLEYNKPQGIFRYKNQSAIEWNPIEVDNKIIVAQCKFYDTSLNSHKNEIIDMLDGIDKNYKTPCELKFYTNQDLGQGRNSNDSQVKIEIEQKAQQYNIIIDWRTNESYFLSPDVALNQELMKYFFTDTSIYDLVYEKQRHTKMILNNIHTQINFNSQIIEIDKINEITELENQLELYQVVVLSGVGGSGKTAIIKKFYEKIEKDVPCYIFKASEFETNQIDNLFGQYNLVKFIEIHQQYKEKIIVIDSAEKILDINNQEPFKEFISTLIQNDWKVIFTTRYAYLDDLNYHLTEVLSVLPIKIDIKNLSRENLEDLSNIYKFNLPQDDKLFDLIKNPFYLNEYLINYSDDNINYQDFKNSLWNRNISTSNMEKCFFEFAFKRANEGKFYINIECSNNSLEELQEKGILGYEKSLGYFITHDIYEEWALERIVNKEFINNSDLKNSFDKIGSSLPIRRAFRNWISEKLLLNDDGIKALIEKIIDSTDIELFWKDEIIVSILLSKYSNTFFEKFKKELLETNYEFLSHISFLLRLACKEVDSSFWENMGIKVQKIYEAKYIFTKPKGSGWKSFITFVHDNIETIKLQKIDTILPILDDWNAKFQNGNTTKKASTIALKYYDLINKEEYKYKDNTHNICKVIANGSYEIKDKLSTIFDEIIEKKLTKQNDNYYELSKMILTDFGGLLISKNLPEHVLKLAGLFWTKKPKKIDNDGRIFSYYEREEVEDAFNIAGEYEYKYFPASALQTPIYFLLKNHFNLTIDFILDFINKSVEHYAKSNWKYEKIQLVDIFIDEKNTIQQYHSQALWNIYRGNSSPVMPYLIQSIHMALEKYLLDLLDDENLESILFDILKKSKSSSISAIIASIILAKPNKTFRIATILFKTKEFIQADFYRYHEDQRIKSLYDMGYSLNRRDKIFRDERLKTCEDKHRNSALEGLFLSYQMFRTNEISEEKANNIQKILWSILDNYYKKLPEEKNQNDDDKTWRIILARMDRRQIDIQTEKVDSGVQITFNPKLSSELQEYSKEVQKEAQNTTKYISLYLWSKNKIENNQNYKKYTDYEKNPILALEQIKEVIAIEHDQRDFMFQDETFVNVSIILLKDYTELLPIEDKELCKDILLKFVHLPLGENYHDQVSDGIDKAIKYLPILLIHFPELKNDIKILLLLHLFDDYKIGMSGKYFYDFSIEAINTYFISEICSFITVYLLLKPKYDELIKSNYSKQTRISKEKLLDKFYKSNENVLEKFISNEMGAIDINIIETIKLEQLMVVLKMFSLKIISVEEKEIVKKIIEIFFINIFNTTNNEINYELKQNFIDTFSLFILNTSNKADIAFYLEPFIKLFQPKEEVTNLLTQLVYKQDRINKYDNFWYIWELLETNIIAICSNGNSYHNIEQIIKVYLLASGVHGAIWKDTANEWHSLKDKDIRFFKKFTKKITNCSSILYSVSKLLNGIGSKYVNDEIDWISDLLTNNGKLLNDELDSNTVFLLENLIRKFIFIKIEKIKKDSTTKNNVLKILNFLVNKGSSIAYMLRERIF